MSKKRKLDRKKIIIYIITGALLLAVIIWGAVFFWQNFRGAFISFKKASQDITELIPQKTYGPESETNQNSSSKGADEINSTITPLMLPEGFSISIFANKLPGARVIIFDSKGNLWVSQTGEGKITKLVIENGKLVDTRIVLERLNNPHGLAFDPENPDILYFAEETKISKININSTDNINPLKIIDLPQGGRHFTRTIGFGPDKKLYISIGSTCNVCIEKDPRYAAIYVMDKDSKNFRQFASGLRNSVFFTWNPYTEDLWATEMGRDLIGDDLPPDEINIIQDGKNYGWPYVYGKNILDKSFKSSAKANDIISASNPSYIDIPAHSAPLGLAFFPEQGWPEIYKYNLLVAYHGSWNRSTLTGYKVVRLLLDQKGNYIGVEDFITGWLTQNNEVLGRPVGLLFGKDSNIFISDDKAGVIYELEYFY